MYIINCTLSRYTLRARDAPLRKRSRDITGCCVQNRYHYNQLYPLTSRECCRPALKNTHSLKVKGCSLQTIYLEHQKYPLTLRECVPQAVLPFSHGVFNCPVSHRVFNMYPLTIRECERPTSYTLSKNQGILIAAVCKKVTWNAKNIP